MELIGDQVLDSLHADTESRVQAALDEASIFAIGSFGWASAEDPDPDYLGHAMWQVDAPPVDRFLISEEDQRGKPPTDLEKEIFITGEDFWGLMEASRLSLGLALVWKGQAQRNPVNQSSFFWLHYIDALLKLAIASDRLRDLMIVACTGAPAKIYKKGKHRQYVHSFENAAALIAKRGIQTPELVEPISALPALSHKLYKHIEERNEIVHDMATRMARFLADRLKTRKRQKNRFADNSERRGEVAEEVERAIERLKDWYNLLITTSNYVFQVEYWTRRSENLRRASSITVD